MHILTAIEQHGNAAKALARVDLNDDWYHQNISKAAKAMVDAGLLNWTYVTQYSSGNSMWFSPIPGSNDSLITSTDKEGNFYID
jgi:hypothetical protein